MQRTKLLKSLRKFHPGKKWQELRTRSCQLAVYRAWGGLGSGEETCSRRLFLLHFAQASCEIFLLFLFSMALLSKISVMNNNKIKEGLVKLIAFLTAAVHTVSIKRPSVSHSHPYLDLIILTGGWTKLYFTVLVPIWISSSGGTWLIQTPLSVIIRYEHSKRHPNGSLSYKRIGFHKKDSMLQALECLLFLAALLCRLHTDDTRKAQVRSDWASLEKPFYLSGCSVY